VILAEWPLPAASSSDGSHIPEPGDIIRVRWEELNTTDLQIRASYFDASTDQWHTEVISETFNLSSVSDSDADTDDVNFLDGYHTAASVTIDSSDYSIRRFKLGTLDTYP
jgi:hypothetical protein